MASDRESITAQLDMLSDQFDEMWAIGTRPDIEQFALRMETGLREALYELLIPIDIEYRLNLGHSVVAADYLVYGSRAAGIASRELNESISDGYPEAKALIHSQSPALELLDGFHDRVREVQGYRLLRRIRHGSLGQSWITETKRGHKPLTIKLLPFENERRDELANLSQLRNSLSDIRHPNVKRIREVGFTERNHLYVVSDYADGLSIVQYCDRECLNVEERLSLFVAFCRIVDQLHSQGLVHGELNAFTVLIQVIRKQISIVDWGVAKSIGMHHRLDEPALFGSLKLSRQGLSFFAPETLDNGMVNAKTDQFSMGVILHQLLTGRTPSHDIVSSMRDESADVVAETIRSSLHDGAVDSTTWSAIPSQVVRQVTVPPIPNVPIKRLARLLRGNLDAIVAKATALDPASRYETVGQFADDIEHHLHGQPVQASKKRRTILDFARRFFGS